MASLEQVLASVPGLAGYQAQVNQNNATTLGNLQQGQAVGGILAQIQRQAMNQQAMQEQQQLKGLLAQSGGDPANAVKALLQSGNPQAIGLAAKLHSLIPKPAEDRVVAPGGALISPTGEVRYQAPFKPDKPDKPPEIVQLTEMFNSLPEGDPRKKMIGKAIEAKTFGREEQIRLAASLRPPPQERNLQLTTDANGMQLIVNPDGTTRPLTTQDGQGVKKPVAADKPMTEFQGKAALYGTRSAQSDKVLRALEDKISTTGLVAGQSTGVIGTALMSADQQRVDQAQRDFVNAVLRQESGAVISPAEFENAKKQYFPQPGNDARTISQKRANRQMAIQGFSRMSGPKGAADIQAIISEPLLPGVQGTNPTPQQASGKIGGAGGYVETRKTADGRTLGKKADGTIEEIK